MYRWGRTAVTQELKNAAASNVVYLRDDHLSNINFINNQLAYLLSNYDISSFFVEKNILKPWDYYIRLYNIKRLLSLMRFSNPYISEIRFYFLTHHIGLSSEDGIILYNDSELNALETCMKNQSKIMAECDDELFVYRSLPYSLSIFDDSPVFFAQAIINKEMIKSRLSSFSQYSNRNALLINHTQRSVIYSESYNVHDLSESAILKIIERKKDETVYFSEIESNQQKYTVAACYSSLLDCSFVQFMPHVTLHSIPDRFKHYILIFSFASIIVITVFSYITYRLLKHPINDIINAFSKAGHGHFNTRLRQDYSTIEYKRLSQHFNDMLAHINKLIETNYEQTLRLQHAELKQLQAQINPHFLYNSFFLLRHMVKNTKGSNEKQIEAFINYLGEYFQYLTKNESGVATLQEEMDHSLNYLSIQMMRFPDTIEAQIEEIPMDYRDVCVPRLILQPIFENICEHGIKATDLHGLIRVSFLTTDENRLSIIIEDNGNELSDRGIRLLKGKLDEDKPVTETSGLVNIHKRLRLHFGPDCGLILSRSSLGGLCTTLVIKRRS